MASLPMIFVRQEEFPMIGKFDEQVHLDKAKQPVKMYFKDEEILEEAIDENLKKDSEYYKRKRQRRKALKSKSQLVIEDAVASLRDPSGPLKGLMYEGKMSNLNLSDSASSLGPTPFQSKQKAKSLTEAPFKFVILQPQKYTVNNEEKTQILVTPVGDWFSFKKPSLTGQKLLDEIDDDFDSKAQRDKAKLNKYKKIAQAFQDNDNNDDGTSNKKDSNAAVDDFSLPAAFGRTSMKASKKAGTSRKKVLDTMETERGISHLQQKPGESAADVDAEQEYDEWCGGDYTKNFADDDEEQVGIEQMELQDKEDDAVAQDVYADPELGRVDKDGHLVSLEREDEDEDDDDDEFDGDYDEEEGGEGAARSEGGMVDLDMERDAREYRKMMMAQQQSTSKDEKDSSSSQQQISAAAAATAVSSASLTRKRDRSSLALDEPPVASLESSAAVASAVDTTMAMSAAETTVSAPAAYVTEIELTDDSVRAYILNLGGRVTVAALKESYNKKVKEYNKAHSASGAGAGGKKLVEILLRLTITEDDPLLGKVLRLNSPPDDADADTTAAAGAV